MNNMNGVDELRWMDGIVGGLNGWQTKQIVEKQSKNLNHVNIAALTFGFYFFTRWFFYWLICWLG